MAARQQQAPGVPGTIIQAFASPIARIAYPYSEAVNEQLADLVLARLYQVDNHITFKTETAANMTEWGEPLIDALSSWVVQTASRFVEALAGKSLQEAYLDGVAKDRNSFNGITGEADSGTVSVAITRSWASIYAKGSQHPSHFHPNTALAAIYYVQSPGTCDIDLLDPRPNLDYFDPGIQIADEGRNLRLRCKPGELLLFPGWLKHAVPEFGGDLPRISMSWNLAYQVLED
jgi:hypothetical protein